MFRSEYRGTGRGGERETEVEAREEKYTAMSIHHALLDSRKPKDEKNTTHFVNFKFFGFIFSRRFQYVCKGPDVSA